MSKFDPAGKGANAGFTLIELVLVIAILGILAAMAMPRFVDLGRDARIAILKGVQGAMESAWNMAHASQLAQGLTASSSITVDGLTITMSNGYPTAEGLVNLIKVTGFDTSEAGTFKVKDGETARTGCQVVYTAATASGTPPVVTPPTATLTTTGC